MSTRYVINGQTHHQLPEGHHLGGGAAPTTQAHDPVDPSATVHDTTPSGPSLAAAFLGLNLFALVAVIAVATAQHLAR